MIRRLLAQLGRPQRLVPTVIGLLLTYGTVHYYDVLVVASIEIGKSDAASAEELTRDTQPGQSDTVQLGSGDVLRLNGNTAIHASSTPKSRQVALERGELYAEVVQDYRRPLHLTIGRLVVVVLGTELNILALGDATEFALTAGRARLFEQREDGELQDPEVAYSQTSHAREAVFVDAGDVVDIAHDANGAIVITRKAHDMAEAQARARWREGVVTFPTEPLERAVKIMNLYSRAKVVVDDPALAGIKLGGTFRPNEMREYLQSLKEVGIKVVRDNVGTDGSGGTIYLRHVENSRAKGRGRLRH